MLPKTECIRNDTWKFIRYEDHPDFFELYNLKEDPNVVYNLALDKEYKDKVEFYSHLCDFAAASVLSQRITPDK